MTSTDELLDDAVRSIKDHPTWHRPYLAKDLQARHGISPCRANSIARRAQFIVDQEVRKWRPRQSKRRHLPGETSGLLDNIFRALEDARG